MGFYALTSAGTAPKTETMFISINRDKKQLTQLDVHLTVGEVKYGNGNAKSIGNIVAEVLNFQMNATLRKSANA